MMELLVFGWPCVRKRISAVASSSSSVLSVITYIFERYCSNIDTVAAFSVYRLL